MSRLRKAEEERRRKSEKELERIDNILRDAGSSLEGLIREEIDNCIRHMEVRKSC